MFLECPGQVGPHLLEVLLPVLGKESGKGALLSQRVTHVLWSEGFSLPVVNSIMVPRCVCVRACAWGRGEGRKLSVSHNLYKTRTNNMF